MVGIDTEQPVSLMEDENAMVGDNHGWEGRRYTASVKDNADDQDDNPGPNGMYEAMVYSKVYEDEPPGEGEIFSARYTLDDGSITVSDSVSDIVKSEHFTYTTGVQTFELYEISGTYTCNSDDPLVKKCAVEIDPEGFQLGLVDTSDNDSFAESTTSNEAWYFTPDDPSYQFPGKPGTYNYISYGWWMHMSEDENNEYIASAFLGEMGDSIDSLAVGGLNDVSGTAKYVGGAAGKYALYNESAGERNDSGDFTAKVELAADFTTLLVTGVIDTFMDADGMEKPWSVELKQAEIQANGGIMSVDQSSTEGVDESISTVWMIDGMAADPSGTWSGKFHDQSADDGSDVPKVATGMFFSTYGDEGKMVGAFGVEASQLNSVDIED